MSRKQPTPTTFCLPEGFTRVRRLRKHGTHRRATVDAILDATPLCHIAHVVAGQPVATPTLHWRIGDRVYWHGSTASRMLRAQRHGAPVCLTATVLDGWVLARSAFNHAMNYRAVMCFGIPEPVIEDARKLEVLETFLQRWFPGRWARLRPTRRKELAATVVMSMPLDAASAKVRSGPPEDPRVDLSWPVWAGEVPLESKVLRPRAAPGVHPGLSAPKLGKPLRRK